MGGIISRRDGLEATSIAARLVDEYGYSPTTVALTVQNLMSCAQPVWDAFIDWWQTGALASEEVEGFTVKKLVEERKIEPVGAYIMLNWLLSDPVAAKAVLARGFDVVRPRQRTQ